MIWPGRVCRSSRSGASRRSKRCNFMSRLAFSFVGRSLAVAFSGWRFGTRLRRKETYNRSPFMRMRVLIVDDEPYARKRLRRFLHDQRQVEIVGECASGQEAVVAIEKQKLD